MIKYSGFPGNTGKSPAEELKKYPKAEVIWCQDEPRNMGAWTFVEPYIEDVLVDLKHACKRPRYVGRTASASTSTGLIKTHQREQAALVKAALEI